MMSLLHFACLWLWCCWTTILLHATEDSLSAGQNFNSNSKLCSNNRIYCLMFQEVTQYNPSGYLVIYRGNHTDWYRWVGNRDQPVDIHTVRLVLSEYGKLTIESDKKIIILYEPPHSFGNGTFVAKLLNTGNFVLQSIQDTKKTSLWQSFDTPTDTLIPGMKLGKNLRTGHNWSLVSWIVNSVRNPASGPYKLDWDPRGQQLIISHRETVHWKSGKLEANNKFQYINEFKNIVYEVVDNKDEQSFSLKTPNNEEVMWALLGNGQFIDRTTGYTLADVEVCYGYNTNGGCQFYERKPSCRDEGDTFVIKSGIPSYQKIKYVMPANFTNTDCRLICWRDCNCVGFTTYNSNGTGCLIFFNSSNKDQFTDSHDEDELHMLEKNIQGKHKWLWIWISGAAAMICALICICVCIVYRVKMGKKGELDVNALKVFSISSLRFATKDFSDENKLGSGAYGVVYKGTLPSGKEVAVKRLKESAGEPAFEQIKNELTLMSQFQHKNLVQVLGYCLDAQKLLLVLELVKNTSLEAILFRGGSTEKKELVWEERYQIIEGIAHGLYYLHSLHSDNQIIHRDLKPGNILLDENMNPKIADFGLARLLHANEKPSFAEFAGTRGYMAPECALGQISDKVDVFSFGVILLRILSGQSNPFHVVESAWDLWQKGEILSFKDPNLSDLFNEEILKFLEIGLLCTQKVNYRPTMTPIIPLILDRNRTNIELELKNPFIFDTGEGMEMEREPVYSHTGVTLSMLQSLDGRVESSY